MGKIGLIGSTCIDDYLIDGVHHPYAGGGPVNMAVHASKAGAQCTLYGAVGTDGYGRKLKKETEKYGIDLSHFQVIRGRTPHCDVLLEEGERILGDYDEGVMLEYRLNESDIDSLVSQDICIMDYWGNQQDFFPVLKEKGAVLAFDCADRVDSDLSQQLIPYCDLVFFSAKTQGEQLYQQMEEIRKAGPHTVIATLGKEGSVALDRDGIHISAVTPVERPFDTMGAGDCYIGTFLACWSERAPIEECMKKAGECAAQVLTYHGAFEQEETEIMYDPQAGMKKMPQLRRFDEKKQMESVNGALALRPQIENIVKQILDGNPDGIWFMGIGGTYASAMQAEVYMRGRSKLPVYVDNAAEFLTTGNRRFTENSVVILSSESGNTKEMVALVKKVHEIGGKVFAFIDTPGSELTKKENNDWLIVYPKNEQLKFYMTCNAMMHENGEMPDYDDYNENMESYLAQALVDVEKEADAWAQKYAVQMYEQIKARPDLPHYFIASGNQYGACYSYGMCYWEEQLWVRTKTISCQEFFHGMQEIIVEDTPVTLFMGEDEQRPLAQRVADFLPKVNANHVIIDTKEFALKGIREEYRGTISHLVMHAVNNRVDAYMEYMLRHPMEIRRYYRQFDY